MLEYGRSEVEQEDRSVVENKADDFSLSTHFRTYVRSTRSTYEGFWMTQNARDRQAS